jgi:hypothetical protein
MNLSCSMGWTAPTAGRPETVCAEDLPILAVAGVGVGVERLLVDSYVRPDTGPPCDTYRWLGLDARRADRAAAVQLERSVGAGRDRCIPGTNMRRSEHATGAHHGHGTGKDAQARRHRVRGQLAR